MTEGKWVATAAAITSMLFLASITFLGKQVTNWHNEQLRIIRQDGSEQKRMLKDYYNQLFDDDLRKIKPKIDFDRLFKEGR